ncbi:MAG: replication-associated recombination protein A, partial [Actinomycetota bacterium]|nr:replication-associated recombination protein A [Actinomycetota bacterium]
DVREGRGRRVPPHLRDGHYTGARDLGHGEGYIYPHDTETGWVDQQYLPDDMAQVSYYSPSHHGFEAEILQRRRNQRTADSSPDGALGANREAKDQKA